MPARAAPEWPMLGMPLHMSAIMFTIAPPLRLHPLCVDFARHQEAAGEVGAHDSVPALRGNLFQRRRELPARIVDEEIDAPVIGEHRAHDLGHALFLANVGDVAARGAARFA